MFRRFIMLVAIMVATLGLSRSAFAQGREIKLGTLAPKDSAWGKAFAAWSKSVEDETGGALKLTWSYSGSKGDETAMVSKMRSKEIDGAAISATGLSQIWPSIIALQMPGLFPTWAKLDAVRDKVSPRLDKEFAAQGFVILGKGDAGMSRIMSRGVAIRTPDDLKKAHPFYVAGDPIGQKFLEIVGVPSPKALAVPAILSALASRTEGSVDVINAPALAAEQLGWAPHMTHIDNFASGVGIGAIVINKETFDSLPADARAVLQRTGKSTGQSLTEKVRTLDDQAFARIKGNKTVVELTDAEKASWDAVFAKVRNALKAEGKIRADFFDEVVAAAR